MNMLTQAEKGHAFRELHQREDAFIIPNPWNVGTARLLAGLGFESMATTSAGLAFSMGQRDNTIHRKDSIAHATAIAAATDLPVSGDLEDGYGDTPEDVAETIRLAAAGGLDILPDLLYSFAILGARNADGDLSGLCRGILAAA